jgi:hypothetical protein
MDDRGHDDERGPSSCSELGIGPSCAIFAEYAASSGTKREAADIAEDSPAYHRAGPRPDRACITEVWNRAAHFGEFR